MSSSTYIPCNFIRYPASFSCSIFAARIHPPALSLPPHPINLPSLHPLTHPPFKTTNHTVGGTGGGQKRRRQERRWAKDALRDNEYIEELESQALKKRKKQLPEATIQPKQPNEVSYS